MATRTIAGRTVDISAEDVDRAVDGVLPEPLRDHYVVVGGRRFPPKQVIQLVTGIDRADFTTHHARRVLQRLGFSVGRVTDVPPTSPATEAWPHGGREAEALRPHMGRWVGKRGLEVLVAADDPLTVVAWLNRHGQRGAAVFRVPLNAEDSEVPPS